MSRLRHELRAACPPEAVWSVLADLLAVERYNPSVAEARLVDGPAEGVGAARACTLRPSGSVVERVDVWEPGRAVGLAVVESGWPMEMRWTTRVSPDGEGARVEQDLDYTMRYGPLGWALDRLFVGRTLDRSVGATLAAFVAHAEALYRAGATPVAGRGTAG